MPEIARYEDSGVGSLRDLIRSIEVIRLDHQNSITLGQFLHVLHRDSSYYIGDLSGTKLIYRFKENGQFLNSIGRVGKGPGEYLYLKDFYVDDSTNDIFILSYPDIRISHYDKTGRFLDRKIAPYGAESFTKIKDRFWVYTGINNGYIPEQIILFDSALHLIRSSMPLPTKTTHVSLGPSFSYCKGQNYLTMAFNPNLYQIEGDSLLPIIHFDYGKKAITESYWNADDSHQALINLQNNGFCFINAAWISEQYFLMEHIEQKGIQNTTVDFLWSIKNRKTGKWKWIRQDDANQKLEMNHQKNLSNDAQPTWYIAHIKGFAKDGRLMVFLNGMDIDLLTNDDYALISNPEQLKNADPEMDMFLFLCTLK